MPVNQLLAFTIIPNLAKKPSKQTAQLISRLISEMSKEGLNTLQAQSAWLRFKPETRVQLVLDIDTALVSGKEDKEQNTHEICTGSFDKASLIIGKWIFTLSQFVECRQFGLRKRQWCSPESLFVSAQGWLSEDKC